MAGHRHPLARIVQVLNGVRLAISEWSALVDRHPGVRLMKLERLRLLLVGASPGDARLIRELLHQVESFPFELRHVPRMDDASGSLARHESDAVILDITGSGDDGPDGLVHAMRAARGMPFIVLVGPDDGDLALRAVRAGAQDSLVRGEMTGRVIARSVRYAVERARRDRGHQERVRKEQRARAAAEAALRSRDRMLAVVAHELRNPLGAINTTVALLGRGAIPSEELRRKLEVVRRSTGQMDRLVQDLLDIAPLDDGGLRVEQERLAPAPLLAEAVALLDGQSAEAGLRLECEVEPATPDVHADRRRTLQVLTNLVGNALRFTPVGGRITLHAGRFGDSVLFSVSDTGAGIPADELPHLFDSAWQSEHARRGGTGRGLAISKWIVEAQGGRAWAASEVGIGSTFFFTIPVAPADPAVATAAPRDTADLDALAPPDRVVTVLLVDDHAAIRHGLTEILRQDPGMRVVGEAATGQEAIIMAQRLRPDVVLMDLALPGVDGIEATRQIRASVPGARVLALTAETEDETLLPVLRAGGSGFVRKTTAHEDLIAAISVVARDEVFLYPSANRLLLGDFLLAEERDPLAGLSDQERELLRLSAEGYNSREIGKQLFLSPNTIDNYRARLMRRLGLTHRSGLVRLALETGLLRAE